MSWQYTHRCRRMQNRECVNAVTYRNVYDKIDVNPDSKIKVIARALCKNILIWKLKVEET